jgi:hypothetical protein
MSVLTAKKQNIMVQETTTLFALIKANIFYFLGAIFGLLAPIQYIILLVFFFIWTDTAFGVWASKKTGNKITSRKLSSFIGKMIVYATLIILSYGLGSLLLDEFLWYLIKIKLLTTKVTAIALCFAEIFSIDEKLKNVNPEKGIFYHFKRLLNVAKLVKKESKELKD